MVSEFHVKCPKCGKEMDYLDSSKIFKCTSCGEALTPEQSEKEKESYYRRIHEKVKESDKYYDKFAKEEEEKNKFHGVTKEEWENKPLKERIGTKWGEAKEKAVETAKSIPKTTAVKGLEYVGKQGKQAAVTGGMVVKEGILGVFAGPSIPVNIWLTLFIAFIISPTFFPVLDTLSAGTGLQLHTTSFYNRLITPNLSRINQNWLNFNYWNKWMITMAIVWPFVAVIQLFVTLMTQNTEIPIASNIFYKSAAIPRGISRATLYTSAILLTTAGMMYGVNYAAANVWHIQYCPPEVPSCNGETGTKIGETVSLKIDDSQLIQSSVKSGGTLTAVIKLENDNTEEAIEGIRLKIYQVDDQGNPDPSKTWQSQYSCSDTNPCRIESKDSLEVMVDITGLTISPSVTEDWEQKPLVIQADYNLKSRTNKQYYIYRSDMDVTEPSPEHVRGPGPVDLQLWMYPNQYSVKLEKGGGSKNNNMPILMNLKFINNDYGEANINGVNISQTGKYLLGVPTCQGYAVQGTNDTFKITDTFNLKEKREDYSYPLDQKFIGCTFKSPTFSLTDPRIMVEFSASFDYQYSQKQDSFIYVYR